MDSPTSSSVSVLESNDFQPGPSGRNQLRVLAAATSTDQSRVDEILDIGLGSAAHRSVNNYSLGIRKH